MGYLDKIRVHILDWNIDYPVDAWWRARYNIPYGSPSHLDMDMIDMRIAYEEEILAIRINKELERRAEEAENKMVGISSDKRIVEMSKDEIDKEFEDLDITQYQKK